MKSMAVVVLSFLIEFTVAVKLTFPNGFKFGAASAAHQVEGAWNISDRSEDVWDRYTHENPTAIRGSENADVACDSYHLWREDVKLAADLGLDFYRFSISWSRLLPSGFPDKISEDGKRYYNDLINGLLEKGIEPVVTLFHYDMPQNLQDLGGWLNSSISDWFADYAKVAYTLYGDRVKTWLTINEALALCSLSYNNGLYPPIAVEPVYSDYICNRNILLAHAKAYRVYEKYFKRQYHGRISLANNLFWYIPSSQEDADLAEIVHEYSTGRYSHAIYSKEGGWPPALEQKIAEKSKSQGYNVSKLPSFTKEEIKLIKGSYDFFGLNYYTNRIFRKAKTNETLLPFLSGDIPDLDVKLEWEYAGTSLVGATPAGLRNVLNWARSHYGNLDFIITENGFYHNGKMLDDSGRVLHIRHYLEQVLLAIEDGVNVTAYTYWTLLDNFEWLSGYDTKFGLHEVDFEDPNRRRTPRKSASYYASIIKARSLDVPLEPVNWNSSK